MTRGRISSGSLRRLPVDEWIAGVFAVEPGTLLVCHENTVSRRADTDRVPRRVSYEVAWLGPTFDDGELPLDGYTGVSLLTTVMNRFGVSVLTVEATVTPYSRGTSAGEDSPMGRAETFFAGLGPLSYLESYIRGTDGALLALVERVTTLPLESPRFQVTRDFLENTRPGPM